MPATTYTISGIIYDKHNTPLNGVLVSVYEIDLRSEKLLGSQTTPATGAYRISFKDSDVNPEYKGPDVCISVIHPTTGKLLGRSPIQFNIASNVTIDYKIGDGDVLPTNEFDRLVALLTPLLTDSKLRFDQLEESDKTVDISFLAGETGEPFDLIKALADAHRLFISTKIDAAVFYALLRMGFPSELPELLEVRSGSIRSAVEQAIQDNIISSKFLEALPAIITQINTLAAKQMSEGSSEKSAHFKTIMGVVLDKNKQRIFLDTWYENDGDPEKFWEALKEKNDFTSGKTLENTQKLVGLHTLTAGQPELTAALYKRLNTGDAVNELSTLAALSAEGWEKAIIGARVKNFPAGIEGDNDNEKTANYAAALERVFGEAYPTARYAERLRADTQSAFANKADLNRFFDRNPDFDLSGVGIVKALEQADYTGITQKEEVKQAVKTIGRLHRLTDLYEGVSAFQRQGLHSATAIVNKYGKQQFVAEFATVLDGEAAAANVYSRCVSVNKRATALLTAYKASHDIPLVVTHNQVAATGVVALPLGYRELFADGELCDCDHCQSVYSPAAYFVDLLAFLRRADESAYDTLLGRRPDLDDILLTCANTNTTLPYIDLVIELLEKQVRHLVNPGGNLLDGSYQTVGTAALLDAIPENRDGDAYAQLKGFSEAFAFAYHLPFAEPLEQIKLYTEKLGFHRHQLAILLHGGGTAATNHDAAFAKRWFGASEAAWRVISGSTSFTASVPEEGKVSQVLGILKISYDILLQLLETRFLNPETDGERAIIIAQTPGSGDVLTCDTDQLFLSGISPEWMNSVARFIRLWKLTGWDLRELDNSLAAVGVSGFPAMSAFEEKVMFPLYQIDRLKKELGIGINGVLALLEDGIGDAVDVSLAKKLNVTVVQLRKLMDIVGLSPAETGTWNPSSLLVFLEEVARIKSSAIPIAAFYEAFSAMDEICRQLGFADEKVSWLVQHSEALGIAPLWGEDISAETVGVYGAFKKLYALSRLNRVKTNAATQGWTALFDELLQPEPDSAACLGRFTEVFEVDPAALALLADRLVPDFPADFLNTKKVISLINGCAVLADLNVTAAEQLTALLEVDPDEQEAAVVMSLLKSRYNDDEWPNAIKPISDALRAKRRDALVAWLLASNQAWQSTADIYKHLLIDTDMAACMDTSRIKQAISSVQLYIDRSLMGLEEGIELSEDFAKQWNTWRKQYRVWEANRKIFLYPENWIEPELRDDKSPFFAELESQLKQNEVTEETAKEALLVYLEKLDTVAKLEIVGLFNDDATGILHVFGRTNNVPHQYFYRTQYKRIWSAWEKVALDIAGDHLLPVVWNGRLLLFWGQFAEKQLSNSNQTTITGSVGAQASMTMESPPPVKYYETTLAWSEYKNGDWGGKKLSKASLSAKDQVLGTFNPTPADFSIHATLDNGNLAISFYASMRTDISTPFVKEVFRFRFNGCNAVPEATIVEAPLQDYLQTNSNTEYVGPFIEPVGIGSKLLTFENAPIRKFVSAQSNSEKEVLGKPIGKFKLLMNSLDIQELANVNYFYEDEKGVFLVESKRGKRPIPGGVLQPRSAVFLRTVDVLPAVYVGAALFPITFAFRTFWNPLVCQYIRTLNRFGIDALYTNGIQSAEKQPLFSTTSYAPSSLVATPHPAIELSYKAENPYALYNWELFFHIPLTIASQLMQNQQFDEARNWLHYIFNPTLPGGGGAGAERFWVTKPFREEVSSPLSLEELLGDPAHAAELAVQLDYWEEHPFNPHAVARFRISAYMRKTVSLYVDNLLAWGDQLFARDTIESINEATLLYVLAGEILGEKPQTIPPRAKPVAQSFSTIKDEVDRFGNAKAEIELYLTAGADGQDYLQMPYFCLPKNDELLRYWDTIADRLFKIRNCMNIQGVVRQLALFEPPIDPAMLVRAAAAGLTLDDILDEDVSLPHYRFQVVLQKANELCNDVKSLGSQLLAALEKKDAETLSLLRSTHELNMLDRVKRIKEMQRDEAKEGLEGIKRARTTVEARYSFYTDNASAYLNPAESSFMSSLKIAIGIQSMLEQKNFLSSAAALTPEFKLGSGFTLGTTFGGENLSRFEAFATNALQSMASLARLQGESANAKGRFDRRMDEWQFQTRSADLELKQIDKQIAAAEIRLAIAEQDLENHQLQMDQSREVDDYMRSKFSNTERYSWMVGQLASVYFQAYKLAYSTAKKAELCMQHELGVQYPSPYIQFGHWDGLKMGLLSGEQLQHQLRTLENAYLEQNVREMEITKHISLNMLDPMAIVELRERGKCTFEIPEVLYDLDFSGHYRRRIKSVSISIPCIAGPYTSVSATLSLLDNTFRKNPEVGSGYAETESGEDDRFAYAIGAIQSIATSHGQQDSGMFELNFRDERYLPFEGCGAISNWRLELPTEIRQFDYRTISDVIVHVRYTARDGGSALKTAANDTMKNRLATIKQSLEQNGLHIAMHMKHDLPREWQLLKRNGNAELTIDKSRLPYMVQSLEANIKSVTLITRTKGNPDHVTVTIGDGPHTELLKAEELGLYLGSYVGIVLDNSFHLSIAEDDRQKIEDLWLVVSYDF
ncbi:neuraminidase-like domain-containing protein [Parapedobacter defluvii]|uniref:Tc toxin subunit A-related protein n=1 Tax=Parapedobacter defluvii TaxID=2045106 RepID=UPI00333F9BE9